jgi:hypothetical protein
MTTLTATIFDALSQADSFEVKSVAADDDIVTYRVSFRMTIPRDAYSILAQMNHRTDTGNLRRLIRSGFAFCFGEDDAEPQQQRDLKMTLEKIGAAIAPAAVSETRRASRAAGGAPHATGSTCRSTITGSVKANVDP